MLLHEAPLAAILEGSGLAYLAVETATGPMVTPLLFTVSDGRIWMITPRSSAKVAAIRRNPVVGLTAGAPDAMVVLQGGAHLVDPMRPRSLLTALPEALLSPRALGSYVVGNRGHLGDLLGPGALSPRTLAAFRPRRALLVRDQADLVVFGSWPTGAAPYRNRRTVEPPALPVRGIPADIHGLSRVAMPVVVGWSTATGSVVLPGTWDPDRRTARIRNDLFRAAGCLPQAPACVLFDGTEGTNLDGKLGMVVRGRGRAVEVAGHTTVTVRSERVSWWHGEESHTVKAS